MPHLFINHHFFYSNNGLGKSLKGPTPVLFEKQIETLINNIKPASTLLDGFNSREFVFSITIDDGSKSVLEVIDFLINKKIHTCLCICGNTTLRKKVLTVHKINLLRSEIGDKKLYRYLENYFPNFSINDMPLRINIRERDIYRYDDEATRKLKIALNYRLKEKHTQKFIDKKFKEILGPDYEWAEKLYLSKSDIEDLPENIELVYHGTDHKLWKSIKGKSLVKEISPPSEFHSLFSKRYLLSIPYGMNGSWDEDSLIDNSENIKGAFTMGRTLKHNHDKLNDFWWIHRYDQADIFNKQAELIVDLKTL